MNDRPLIKKIRTSEACYIYDTATNKIFRSDEKLFDYLLDGYPEEKNNGRAFTPEDEALILSEMEQLRQTAGCFRTDYPQIDTFPVDQIPTLVDRSMQKGPDLLTLNITEQCNLRCKYCAFSGSYYHNRTHSDKAMPSEMAHRAVEWYLGFDREKYSVGFYGGEPLLAKKTLMDIIKKVHEQVGEKAQCHLTTNGTGMSGEMVDFFSHYKVNLTISIDGPENLHNRYRVNAQGQGSFEKLWNTISWLKKEYSHYFQHHVIFNMVLAPPYDFEAIHQFIQKYPAIFRNGSILHSPLNSDPSTINENIPSGGDYYGQRSRLSRQYMDILVEGRKPDPFLHSLFGKSLILIHKRGVGQLKETSPSHGQCVPGDRKCFVDTDGKLYMCERVQVKPIGDIYSGFDREAITSFLKSYSEFFRERCYGCWAIRLCGKCFNDLKINDQLSADRFDRLCRAIKWQTYDQLGFYCSIREKNENAFDWADDTVIV